MEASAGLSACLITGPDTPVFVAGLTRGRGGTQTFLHPVRCLVRVKIYCPLDPAGAARQFAGGSLGKSRRLLSPKRCHRNSGKLRSTTGTEYGDGLCRKSHTISVALCVCVCGRKRVARVLIAVWAIDLRFTHRHRKNEPMRCSCCTTVEWLDFNTFILEFRVLDNQE